MKNLLSDFMMRNHRAGIALRILFISLFFSMMAGTSQATHMYNGYITYRPAGNGSLTYVFTFNTEVPLGTEVHQGGGVFNFGDGNTLDRGFELIKIPLDEEFELIRFEVEHTYQAAGSFTVSYSDQFRSELSNFSSSINTSFYVESTVVIDPIVSGNNSVTFTNTVPIKAEMGTRYIYDLNAFDPDGDSLSFSFIEPLAGKATTVIDYLFPDHAYFYDCRALGNAAQNAPTSLHVDATGKLEWDAPGTYQSLLPIRYLLAVQISEWRKIGTEWMKIGMVTRELVIEVEAKDVPDVSELCDELTILKTKNDEQLIFPNPSSGLLNISVGKSNFSYLKILNLQGQTILSQSIKSLQNHHVTLNLKDQMKKGIYFIQFYDSHDRLLTSNKLILID